MLIYHPAFDIYHCLFRILQILEYLPNKEYDLKKIQILDYYLLFPHEIKKMQFPRSAIKEKRFFKEFDNVYEDISDKKKMIAQLEPYQICSLKVLASYELINIDKFDNGIIERTKTSLPDALSNSLSDLNDKKQKILDFIINVLSTIELTGDKGLKFRTNLFEYKYDI